MSERADMARARPVEPNNPEAQPLLQLRNVRFAWRPGEPDVIDIADFTVTRGERLFIAGPSGSGKSTLLSLLGGVVSPREGQVVVLNTDLATLPASKRDRFRADHTGFVFQLFNLVPYLSMVQNVTLPCRFSASRKARATNAGLSMDAEAMRLLGALELDSAALLSRPVTDLSIGQQQRVAAARALIGSPEIIIADEPTSALDEGTRERFLTLLFRECDARGLTLLFVSHDMRLGKLFNRTADLADINRQSANSGEAP